MAQICVDVNLRLFFIVIFFVEEQAEFDPQTVRPGSRYSHVQEVQERLNFLRCNIINYFNFTHLN